MEYSHQFTDADEHQIISKKSVKTEFIKEDREETRDPEPCRIKHTEDTEEQTGWSLFFINNADGSKVSSSFRFFYFFVCCNWKNL